MRLKIHNRFTAALMVGGSALLLAHPALADFPTPTVTGSFSISTTNTFESYLGGTQNVPTGAAGTSTANTNYYDVLYSSTAGANTNIAAKSNDGVVSTSSQYYSNVAGSNYSVPGSVANGYYSSVQRAYSGNNALQIWTQLTSSTTTFGSYNDGSHAATSAIGFQRVTSRATNGTANTNQGQEDGYPTVDLGGTVSFKIFVDAGVPTTTATGGVYGTTIAAGLAPIAVELGISENNGGATLGGPPITSSNPLLYEDYGAGGVANGPSTTGSYPTGGIYVPNGSWQTVTFALGTDAQAQVLGTLAASTRTGMGYLYDMGFTPLSTPTLGSLTAHPTYSIYIDDLTITSSAAPEPSSWALLGAGLSPIAFGARSLRKRRAFRSR